MDTSALVDYQVRAHKWKVVEKQLKCLIKALLILWHDVGLILIQKWRVSGRMAETRAEVVDLGQYLPLEKIQG